MTGATVRVFSIHQRGGAVSDEFKIEYWALSGFRSKAYVSWLNEPETVRGTHKHADTQVYARWNREREEWVEEDPATVIAEYVLKRMGHCGDCAATEAWDNGTTGGMFPYVGVDPEDLCDCAYQTVEGLFAEIGEEQRWRRRGDEQSG